MPAIHDQSVIIIIKNHILNTSLLSYFYNAGVKNIIKNSAMKQVLNDKADCVKVSQYTLQETDCNDRILPSRPNPAATASAISVTTGCSASRRSTCPAAVTSSAAPRVTTSNSFPPCSLAMSSTLRTSRTNSPGRPAASTCRVVSPTSSVFPERHGRVRLRVHRRQLLGPRFPQRPNLRRRRPVRLCLSSSNSASKKRGPAERRGAFEVMGSSGRSGRHPLRA